MFKKALIPESTAEPFVGPGPVLGWTATKRGQIPHALAEVYPPFGVENRRYFMIPTPLFNSKCNHFWHQSQTGSVKVQSHFIST